MAPVDQKEERDKEELWGKLRRTPEQLQEDIKRKASIYERTMNDWVEVHNQMIDRYKKALSSLQDAEKELAKPDEALKEKPAKRRTAEVFSEILEEQAAFVFQKPLKREVTALVKKAAALVQEASKKISEMQGLVEKEILHKGESRDRRPKYEEYVAAGVLLSLMKLRNAEAEQRKEPLPFKQLGYSGALLMYYLGYDKNPPQQRNSTRTESAVNRFRSRCKWKNLRRVGIRGSRKRKIEIVEVGKKLNKKR